jgi:hemerythrin-like domain-containing protein
MRPAAIKIIGDEHLAIAAVLYCLRYHVNQIRYEAKEPDYALLEAILGYFSSYPDHCHHPKEEKYFFAAIARRSNEAEQLIRQLKHEHQDGYAMIKHMKRDLAAYRGGANHIGVHFFNAVEAYAALEEMHMRAEEQQLLPLAERVLTDADWDEIGAAFSDNDNPLFGIKFKQEGERLYRRILELAPAPLGYGQRSA